MTSKADIQTNYFHNYQKNSRLNNPTFNSSFVNDSMSLFTPQKKEVETVVKKTEYKSNFEPFNDRFNTLGIYQQSNNYGRYSKQAFQKSKSYLSQYGTNLVTNKSQVNMNKK